MKGTVRSSSHSPPKIVRDGQGQQNNRVVNGISWVFVFGTYGFRYCFVLSSLALYQVYPRERVFWADLVFGAGVFLPYLVV